MKLLVDSHLDLAWNALSWKRDLTLPLAEVNAREQALALADDPARGRATVTLPEMRRGGVAVCLGTLMARTVQGEINAQMYRSSLDYPTQDIAYGTAQGQLAYYRMLENRGEIAILRTAADLEAHWQQWAQAADDGTRQRLPVGVIVAMEGCDAIVDAEQAATWFADGLRCASLVHYGRSTYATGTGEEGPLTPRGREMLKAFERAGIILDVTHLCDMSFAQALEIYDGPLLASHNNCRTLIPGQRQFSDAQLKQLIARDAVIGVVCDAWMLTSGWVRGQSSRDVVAIDAIADHIDHICQLAGNCKHVAFGTDLDGGYGWEQTPTGLESIADMQKLVMILSRRGYADEQIDAVFHGNWLAYFLRHLPREAAARPTVRSFSRG